VFDQDSEQSRVRRLQSVLVPDRKGGGEMVKQRFLTHFKPWLSAVIKVGGVVAGYQLFDQLRMCFPYAPLNIVDVMMAATVALFMLALVCGIWAWGEWCWFKLRRLPTPGSRLKRAFNEVRRSPTARTSQPVTGRRL
jgi:hypothetical protein